MVRIALRRGLLAIARGLLGCFVVKFGSYRGPPIDAAVIWEATPTLTALDVSLWASGNSLATRVLTGSGNPRRENALHLRGKID